MLVLGHSFSSCSMGCICGLLPGCMARAEPFLLREKGGQKPHYFPRNRSRESKHHKPRSGQWLVNIHHCAAVAFKGNEQRGVVLRTLQHLGRNKPQMPGVACPLHRQSNTLAGGKRVADGVECGVIKHGAGLRVECSRFFARILLSRYLKLFSNTPPVQATSSACSIISLMSSKVRRWSGSSMPWGKGGR